MTFEQVWYFFRDKKDTPCPITDQLVAGGFRQEDWKDGYTRDARILGLENPSQWWHLMYYCIKKMEEKPNGCLNVFCGELIFWMAEVSGAVPAEALQTLQNKICSQKMRRREGNAEIKKLCWDRIKEIVEKQ